MIAISNFKLIQRKMKETSIWHKVNRCVFYFMSMDLLVHEIMLRKHQKHIRNIIGGEMMIRYIFWNMWHNFANGNDDRDEAAAAKPICG